MSPGHSRITHGFLMANEHQTHCDDCIVPLTVRHLLLECPSFGNLRRRFLSSCLDADGNYLISKVLGENVTYKTSGIFGFIDEAGLLSKL